MMAREMLSAEWDVISMLTCILQKGKIKEEIGALSTCLLLSTVKNERFMSYKFEDLCCHYLQVH